MILGLLIRGCHVTGHVDSAKWRDRVASFLSREPPAKVRACLLEVVVRGVPGVSSG
jgi:hypothetical protein